MWASKADNNLCNHRQNVPVMIAVSLSIMLNLFARRLLELFKSMRILYTMTQHELCFRSEMQLSGRFSKLLEVMGKSFQKACGRTVFGIMFSLLWIVLLTW
jgi:hypothetical protein